MFEDLKKKILRSQLLFTVIVILLGLGLAGWNATNAFYVIFGYADFHSLSPDKIRGQLVEVNLKENYGKYYRLDTTTKRSGSTTKTTDYYYIILTGDENTEDWRYYMSIKVPSKYMSQMDKMDDNTYAGYLSTPLRFYGEIKKLEDKEYAAFRDVFEQSDWTDAEIDEETLPYYINTFASKTSMNTIYIGLFAVGAFLLIFGIVRITKVVSGGSLKKLRQDIAGANYSESMAESDYQSAIVYNKKGDVRIGRLMTYYLSGDNARAIPNKTIMWAYQNTVTHRTNGVKTGTTYNIIIYGETIPKGLTLSADNEAVVQDMLKQMAEMFPWIVVGYSDDLKITFNKNRAEFLQLRYNTCEHVAVEPGTRTESVEAPEPDAQA